MTQDELWLAKWQEAIDFLETYHRKPSKFIPEERNMRSWWKHNKKLMNAGELKPERVEMFKQLLELGEKYKQVNQYQKYTKKHGGETAYRKSYRFRVYLIPLLREREGE